MKILALEHELSNSTSEAFQRFATEEARKAWELLQVGLIREFYFRADQQTALLILECALIEEAMSALAELPYIQNSLIAFDLIPLKAYSGFARLFTQE